MCEQLLWAAPRYYAAVRWRGLASRGRTAAYSGDARTSRPAIAASACGVAIHAGLSGSATQPSHVQNMSLEPHGVWHQACVISV